MRERERGKEGKRERKKERASTQLSLYGDRVNFRVWIFKIVTHLIN